MFVELEDHKDILINEGISKELCHVTKTPAKISRKRMQNNIILIILICYLQVGITWKKEII